MLRKRYSRPFRYLSLYCAGLPSYLLEPLARRISGPSLISLLGAPRKHRAADDQLCDHDHDRCDRLGDRDDSDDKCKWHGRDHDRVRHLAAPADLRMDRAAHEHAGLQTPVLVRHIYAHAHRSLPGVEHRIDERSLPWLAGFAGSQPVRIGNAACDHLQLDVFGEVLDAFHQARRVELTLDRTAFTTGEAGC
jgi:hypothetical protein